MKFFLAAGAKCVPLCTLRKLLASFWMDNQTTTWGGTPREPTCFFHIGIQQEVLVFLEG